MDVASYDDEGALALDAAVEAAKALPSDGWLPRLVEGSPFGPIEALLADVRGTVYARAKAQEAGAHPAEVGRIVGLLDRFARAGVEGLPVGPPASAVLANAVLGRVDRTLDAAGLMWARWVDDVVVAGPAERAAETFAAALAAPLFLPSRRTAEI